LSYQFYQLPDSHRDRASNDARAHAGAIGAIGAARGAKQNFKIWRFDGAGRR
jgi:hypothetical protein